MIFKIIYLDRQGNPLLEGTFAADGWRDAWEVIAETPSLTAPDAAVSAEIVEIDTEDLS